MIKQKDKIFINLVPLLYSFILFILAWPSSQDVLGRNGVLIWVLTLIPMLSFKEITPKNVKAIFLQLIIGIVIFFTMRAGVKDLDWNKHHWQFLHSMSLSLLLFLSFLYFGLKEKSLNYLRSFSLRLLPLFFLSIFFFWYLRSTHGIEFSFDYFWFFLSFLTFLLTIFMTNEVEEIQIRDSFTFSSLLSAMCVFLFFTTLVWNVRFHFSLEPGESHLSWAVSLFLLLSMIANGLNTRNSEVKLAKIATTLYLAFAIVHLIFAIIELSQFGPVESRYYHFLIASFAIVSFLPNIIKMNSPFPFRLNLITFILLITFIGPMNLTKLSFQGQKAKLWNLFDKNKMITKQLKVGRAPEVVSDEDRLMISSIVSYIYYSHDINQLKDWFDFNLSNVFRNTTPFIVDANFDQDLANIKGLLRQLGLDYMPKPKHNRNPQKKAPVRKIPFNLVRLKDKSNAFEVGGYKKIIKDYQRPLSINTVISGKNVSIFFNNKDNVLETKVDDKVIHSINLMNLYAPYIAIDDKQRSITVDLLPEKLDIQFESQYFQAKLIINVISGHIEGNSIMINAIDALVLINY